MGKINREWIEAAVIGGAILGGGGGGDLKEGKRFAKLALEFGNPQVKSIEKLPKDSLIVTVSAVGAPSAKDKHVTPSHYVRAVEVIQDQLKKEIGGMITNEIGGFAVVNGLIQSAVLGIPVVDAACNGRAHPTGTMGAMGLSKMEEYVSHQVAVGGSAERYVETYSKGSLTATAKLIRRAAVVAGGLVAVVRNPVSVKYAKENAALGALSQAIELGETSLHGKNAKDKIERVVDKLNGNIAAQGEVLKVELNSKGGFDVGEVHLKNCSLSFWNEYMTMDAGKERIATFPDLIMTMDSETGLPITSAEIRKGQDVTIITTPAKNLNLGSGMQDLDLFNVVEKTLGKDIIKFRARRGNGK